MTAFDYQPRTRVIFGDGAVAQLTRLARELGFSRTLLVADRGLVDAGHVATATKMLEAAGVLVSPFHDFGPNPDTDQVEAGRRFANGTDYTSIVALGGGSSMDLAKAINIVTHNPGSIADYQGYGKGTGLLAPMVAIPTTAGTGSEAQSYAIIAHSGTHMKMAIGDPGAAFRAAILDPALTVSQPAFITATAGYDAISHAVESLVCSKANPFSQCFAREAWRLLSECFERVLANPDDITARGAMLTGANLAGASIENSMLGAAHACANPLTAKFGIAHGSAIALMLPHVVRWNLSVAEALYTELFAGDLAARLEEFAAAAQLPRRLSDYGVKLAELPGLAAGAAGQWTGRFNPRPFDSAAALELYQCAF